MNDKKLMFIVLLYIISLNISIAQDFKKTIEITNNVLNNSLNIREIEIFNGLQETFRLNFSTAIDVHLLKESTENESRIEILLTSNCINANRYIEGQLLSTTCYPMKNASKIYAINNFENFTLIIQKSHSIKSFNFFLHNETYNIRENKMFYIPDVMDVSIWHNLTNQAILSLSTSSNIYIYIYQNTCKLVQTLPFGSKIIKIFPAERSVYLIALIEQQTLILKYRSDIQQFVSFQSIVKTFFDVATVRFGKEFSMTFLALSNHEEVVLYKYSKKNIFQPFQVIAPTKQIILMANRNVALLLFIKNNTMGVYQYNGWRFIKSDFRIFGIKKLKTIIFNNTYQLLINRINETWSLNRISWIKLNKSMNLKKEVKQWSLSSKIKIIETFKSAKNIRNSISLFRNKIRNLKIKDENKALTQNLENAAKKYNALNLRLTVLNEFSKWIDPKANMYFLSLYAKNVQAKSAKKCNTVILETKIICEPSLNDRRVDGQLENIKLKNVRVEKLNEFPCPMPGVKLKDVSIKGLINGISFKNMQDNILKTSGNQVIIGEHIIQELQVNELIIPNLDIATTYTRQEIISKTVHAKKLHLTEGGLLLSLDNETGEEVTMTGKLTVSKAKFNGLIQLRGGLKGRAVEKFTPVVYFNNCTLNGNYTFENVKIMKSLLVTDIFKGEGKSVKNIIDKIVPLTADVPVRLNLIDALTMWTNVTVSNLPNWLIRNNPRMVNVTGRKIALKNVVLPADLYLELPIPRLQIHACSVAALVSNIKTTTIKIGRGTANTVSSKNIYGATELDNLMSNLVISLEESDISQKNFIGPITAKTAHFSDFDNTPFYSFKQSVFRWYDSRFITYSIKGNVLKTKSLLTANGIKVPFPKKIKNAIIEGNLQVKRINDVELDNFFNSVIYINDTIEMETLTFAGNVEIATISTIATNIDVSSIQENFCLEKKLILGDLLIENDFSFPYILFHNLEATTYITKGSIKFRNEPFVKFLNKLNISELLSKIWLQNRATTLKGNILMKNISLTDPSMHLYEFLSVPQFGSWKSMESRLFSKTKLQEINVPCDFGIIIVPNLITQGNSTLLSSSLNFDDLMFANLKDDKNQIIRDKWRFETLVIKDNLHLQGNINNLQLWKDIARYDIKLNKITGVKILHNVTITHLKGSNIKEWSKDILKLTDIGKLITIKGKKTFKQFNGRILNVNTVLEKKMEEYLLNIGDQVFTAPKLIKGLLHCPLLTVKNLVNNINLTNFSKLLFRKDKSFEPIESKLIFQDNLEILGQLFIAGKFQDVKLPNSSMIKKARIPFMKTIAHLKLFALGIKKSIEHYGKYWNKFERVKGNISLFTNTSEKACNYLYLPKLGNCSLQGLDKVVCNKNNTYFLKMFPNLSKNLINQLLSIQNVPLIVQINSGPQSRITIYMYDYTTKMFDIAISIRAPGIIKASISILTDIVWITSSFKSQMLVVRYQPWGNFEKYHLPYTGFFVLNRLPVTNELILIREDGMWKLESLTGPRKMFETVLRADEIQTFSVNKDFFIKLIYNTYDGTTLLRAKYLGI